MGLTNAVDQQQNLSQQDLLASALGVLAQPFSPVLASSGIALSSQFVRGTTVWGSAGTLITGVKLRNGVAAAGTLPLTVRAGIANAAGVILALSANLNALANWTTGAIPFPVFTTGTTKLVLPASGAYIPCIVVNGTWGTTQPTPLVAGSAPGAGLAADGSNPPPNFVWTGQTDLPAVGASLTITGATGLAYWLALY